MNRKIVLSVDQLALLSMTPELVPHVVAAFKENRFLKTAEAIAVAHATLRQHKMFFPDSPGTIKDLRHAVAVQAELERDGEAALSENEERVAANSALTNPVGGASEPRRRQATKAGKGSPH